MALKDWKLSSHQDNKWIKKNSYVQILEDRSSRDASKIKGYIVDIFEFETKDRNSRGFERSFKTKTQALAFAKQYMRNN